MGTKNANLLLRLLIVVLEAFDSIFKLLYTTWYRLAAKARAAQAGGSNPPPPTVIGIILAEPNTADISLHRAASVAAWCLAYESVQQVHLYEPSGHLKQSMPLLQDSLAQVAEQQGRSIAVKCGWTASNTSSGPAVAAAAAGAAASNSSTSTAVLQRHGA
ncbi:hypothetical protein OEZ86_013430 [Tetradesmus obliquus]|nr:hypothetical protein OEZ86_013430 [Tetradesmus obliquus]